MLRPGGTARRAPGLAAAVLAAALAGGCENDDAVLGVDPAPPAGTAVRFQRDIQPIFNSNCAFAFCHAAPLIAPMSLESGMAHAQIAGVPSCEAPGLLRVEPGSSGTSYLVLKLEGTQGSLIGSGACATCSYPFGSTSDCGGRMPLAASALPGAEIQLIRRWIDEGAPDN